MNDIVYGNTRRARDPPMYISGDETITRLYTRKATDVRMRTKKKNESGILNQNLCGSNEGYSTWKVGDPKGTGTVFCNLAYPGSSYNMGSMFRERDIGNLIQLIFSCDDYFRYRDVELITDSHFGHLVPLTFLRLWKVFTTSSFLVSSRIGIEDIEELSKKQLDEEELQSLHQELEKKSKIQEQKEYDLLSIPVGGSSAEEYEKPKKRRKNTSLKSRLQFFEKEISNKNKGYFRV